MASTGDHINHNGHDGAGETDESLKGDELHALGDTHADAAAGGVEEGAVRQGVQNRGARGGGLILPKHVVLHDDLYDPRHNRLLL